MQAANVDEDSKIKNKTEKQTKTHSSKRGEFQIWETPDLTPPAVFEDIQDVDPSVIGKTFEFAALADKFGHDPAQEKIYISNLKQKNSLLKIYDIQGKVVLENNNLEKGYLNVSSLSKGVYQMKFEAENRIDVRKLIIE